MIFFLQDTLENVYVSEIVLIVGVDITEKYLLPCKKLRKTPTERVSPTGPGPHAENWPYHYNLIPVKNGIRKLVHYFSCRSFKN